VNHASTPAASIPSGAAAVASSAIGAKALIVDFGGVLTTSVWDSFAAFCREKGLEEDAVRRLFREDPEALADLRQLETGEMDEALFEVRFAERLRLDECTDLIDSMFRGMLPEPRMVGIVEGAHNDGIKTGLISNSWSTGHYDRELLDRLFDDVVISADVGLHKPDPAIYLLSCQRLGIDPADAVFVDDLRENIAGAEAVGMTGVLHRDLDETAAKLEEIFGVGLRPSGTPGGQKRDAG
jgi:epoxide hydrolase-like predicted phosphatase